MNSNAVAFITGANQGIGLQIAKDLAANGFTVLVGSRNLERGENAAKEIGSGALAVQLDVTKEESIAIAAKRVQDELGHLDVLVNNAAISNTHLTPDMSLEEYTHLSKASRVSLNEVRAIWETNVFGVLAVTQAMLPLLRQSSMPRIVNVSSAVGSLTLNSDPDFPVRDLFSPGYAASKTALNAISLAFAIELEQEAIKVNTVSPGFPKTKLNNYSGTETIEEAAAEVVRVSLLGADGPSGTFTQTSGTIPW